LGEAKVGIPFGLLKDLNPYMVLLVAVTANILVYPLMIFFLNSMNKFLSKALWYKKSALWVAKRAKKGSKENLRKYGYFGLVLFVMVPLPGTGVYAGTIAAYLFKMDYKKAFVANAIGITLSSIIVWGITLFGQGLM
jgi:uncharacterized membrane protein|tara:strand:- start:271 stop:681 length:411 start_codon:yes stop_codon:yes gene_type:complete